MGIGSSLKKAVKKAGKQIGSGATKVYKEYDRYTSSKWGAYLTPYLSMYDSDGRAALRGAYGNYAAAGASAYNPAAGQVVASGLAAYDAHNAPDPKDSPGGAYTPMEKPEAPEAEASAGGVPKWLLIGGGVVALLVVVGGVVLLRKAKG